MTPLAPSRFARAALAALLAGSAACASGPQIDTSARLAPAEATGDPPRRHFAARLMPMMTNPGDAAAMDSYDDRILIVEATKALQNGLDSQGEALLDRFFSEFPDSKYTPLAEYNMGVACQRQGAHKCAADHFGRYVRRGKRGTMFTLALFGWGEASAERGDPDGAIEAFSLLRADPALDEDEQILALTRLGEAYMRAQKYAEAEKVLTEAANFFQVRNRPEMRAGHDTIAEAQFLLGEVARAAYTAAPLELSASRADMAAQASEKIARLQAAQRAYAKVRQVQHDAWTVAAAFRIAALFQDLHSNVAAAEPREGETLDSATASTARTELVNLVSAQISRPFQEYLSHLDATLRDKIPGKWANRAKEQRDALKAAFGVAPAPEG